MKLVKAAKKGPWHLGRIIKNVLHSYFFEKRRGCLLERPVLK